MDSWMLRELGNDDQLRRCPRCSTSITFSYRYGNIIKRVLKKIENVKKAVYEIVYEEITSASLLLPKRYLRNDVTKLKFPPMVLRVVQSRPCTWNCPHYQCKNLCGEECDRPRCDAPCPKKLPCRHPCIGLCGENCPTVCAICHPKKLSSMLADGRGNKTEPTRCLQLFDCGHIIKVEEMDRWMLRELGNDGQLRRCPKCSTSITFSYRYGNIIKRALKKIENVKKTVYEILYEEITSASLLLPKRYLRNDVTKLKFPPMVLRVVQSYSNTRNWLDLPHARGRFAIFMFTLKNHLFILQQAQRTDEVLKKAFIGLRGSSQQQVELKELWNNTKDAIEKIKVYLEEPQLDLKTLSQVFEQTRKFFLFSQVLEAQSKAMMRQIPLSSNGTTRLRLACHRFRVFLKGNDDVLDLEWLRETVNLLRTEMSLPLLPLEAKDFANFPGYQRDVWKSCDQGHVYFTGWIVRGGEDIPVGSEGCRRCTAEQ
ncbi:NFX1-type zinc finger-containing protein 1-like [Orbicella faveolata]|uniref:NFX1-type zinc finger-containing protein 1-like n=1 Tax=Orbicella faveolata TaxID=48498 RepID=UPI0009E1B230|nr:NFX1-type zinc finger-containing protein 1-like [Orbicella faveolata]